MWKCLKCGESHNDAYDVCWKCGSDKNGKPVEQPADVNSFFESLKNPVMNKSRKPKTANSNEPPPKKIEHLVCKQCGGEMRKGKKPIPVNQGFGCLIMLIGLCLCFVLIGIPIIIAGIALSCQQQSVWVCKSCGYMIEKA